MADKVKLTKAQAEMFHVCAESGAAWVTSNGSPNHLMLAEWAERGWAEESEPPANAAFLVAYTITPLGLSLIGGGEQ